MRRYTSEMAKKAAEAKRHVIPVDFKPELFDELKAEAEREGLAVAAYLRHLIVTHPKRQRGKR